MFIFRKWALYLPLLTIIQSCRFIWSLDHMYSCIITCFVLLFAFSQINDLNFELNTWSSIQIMKSRALPGVMGLLRAVPSWSHGSVKSCGWIHGSRRVVAGVMCHWRYEYLTVAGLAVAGNSWHNIDPIYVNIWSTFYCLLSLFDGIEQYDGAREWENVRARALCLWSHR